MYNISKIAFVTDLHLGNAPAARISSFIRRLGQLRQAGIGCVINGGDLFDLRQDMWKPNGLVDGPLSAERHRELNEHSAKMAADNMPRIIENIEGFGGFFSVTGNADWMAMNHMLLFRASLSEMDHHKLFMPSILSKGTVNMVIGDGEHMPMTLSGISSIPALPHDTGALSLISKNPWYKGVLTEEEYNNSFHAVPFPKDTAIFISHMPALGTLDSFFHQLKQTLITDQGSSEIRNIVERRKPILHLTGHVHDAPMASGSYKPFSVSADGKTVTVNPGGGELHDKEIEGILGVKVAIIDPYKLFDMRKAGELTERSIKEEKAIEVS